MVLSSSINMHVILMSVTRFNFLLRKIWLFCIEDFLFLSCTFSMIVLSSIGEPRCFSGERSNFITGGKVYRKDYVSWNTMVIAAMEKERLSGIACKTSKKKSVICFSPAIFALNVYNKLNNLHAVVVSSKLQMLFNNLCNRFETIHNS